MLKNDRSLSMMQAFNFNEFMKSPPPHAKEIKNDLDIIQSGLEKLNNKYFKNPNDIIEIVNIAINVACLEWDVQNQIIRSSEIKIIFNHWKAAFINLIKMKDMLEEGGHEVRWLLAGTNGLYPAFTHTENFLNSIDEGNIFALINACDNTIQNLPIDKGGNIKKGSPLVRVLINVARKWQELTGEKPTCGWDGLNGDSHMGKYYQFTIKFIPLLKVISEIASLPCSMIFDTTDKTIGAYASQAISA